MTKFITQLNKKKRGSGSPGIAALTGITVFYVSALLIFPLIGLFAKSLSISFEKIVSTLSSPRVLASIFLTFKSAFLASAAATIVGLLIAWTLTRYRFLGRNILDSIVDLPFALPTAVAGIALATVFDSAGILGKALGFFHVKVAYTSLGILVAMVFVGFPFVIRTVQPVISDLDADAEEAARTLGASRLRIFISVILPEILPALLSGFGLCFARALGEYGSIIFISGNLPMKTEVVPLIIITKLEQYDYQGATVLAMVMLILSFFFLWFVQFLQKRICPWIG